MTEILKEGGKTIIKTGERIDTMNASQFEQDIQPALVDGGVDLEMDCSDLTYMASSGLRIIQKTMRTVMQQRGQFKMTNVSPEIYKVLAMTGFTQFMKVEQVIILPADVKMSDQFHDYILENSMELVEDL